MTDPEDALWPRASCRTLGVSITPITRDDLLQVVSNALRNAVPLTIAGHNLHSVYLFHTDSEMHAFYDQADIVLTDGAPIGWDYRASGGASINERLGSTDWIPSLNQVHELGRLLVLGASLVSNQACVEKLQGMLSPVTIEGTPGDPWNVEEAVNKIRAFDPQMVLVGLGMPLQEQFVCQLRDSGYTGVVATVGGAIDQIAGLQANAPRWMGPLGLEWLWRLATQPRRLWKRYLLEPWKLVGLRCAQAVRKGS